MYFHQSALQNLVPGEPTPDAIHREEYANFEKAEQTESSEAILTDPGMRQRAALLRARVATGVGSFFA